MGKVNYNNVSFNIKDDIVMGKSGKFTRSGNRDRDGKYREKDITNYAKFINSTDIDWQDAELSNFPNTTISNTGDLLNIINDLKVSSSSSGNGDKGPQGDRGEKGSQGDKGLQGDKGFQGNQGNAGIDGQRGIQGIIGAQGEKGYQGANGAQGVLGSRGVDGYQGVDGAQGVEGTQGAPGEFESSVLEKKVDWIESTPGRNHIVLKNHDSIIGTATDGQTYNVAMVSKWDVADFGTSHLHANLNTSDNVTINDNKIVATEDYVNDRIGELIGAAPAELDTLKEIADQLAEDESAVTGLVETIATKANVEDVYTKTEVNNSFATKEDLNNIALTPGAQGPQGITGEQGPKGEIGVQGPTGYQGTMGAQGVRGEIGIQGLPGVQGPKGEIGVQGQKGDIGTFDASDLENYATKSYVSEEIGKVVGEAPETLDTLKEIADALADNATMTDISEAISTKANAADVYTKAEADDKFLTEHQDISHLAVKSAVDTLIDNISAQLATHESQAAETHATIIESVESLGANVYSKNDVYTKDEIDDNFATTDYVDEMIETIVGDAPQNFDTLKELADVMEDLKVVDVEAVEPVEGVKYTQEEIDAAQEGDEAYGKTTDDWKVEPIEGVEEVSHNMTISEFVTTSMQAVDEKEAVAKVQAKYEALLSLLNIRESQVNSVIVNQELEESSTVTFDEPVSDIIIPQTTAAYVVTGPLDDNSTVTLTSNKYMTLDNTSEEPVSATVQRPAEAGETGTSGTTVYLVGQYDTLTLENVSPNVKSGRDAAVVNNVVITENNTKNLTLTLDLQDGATITNNSDTDVTITDKNDEATVLTIVAPNSTVTLNGGTFESLDATVSDNTLIIKKTAHIGDLIVRHGNVKVEVPRESDISSIITGNIVLGESKLSLIVDHTNFATARHVELEDYYNNYPAEANQDGETWPAFTPSKFPWLVINHEFDGDTEVVVYYQGEKVFDGWKPSAQVEQEGGTMVDRTYAILSVPEDLGLTTFTETSAGNEVLLDSNDIEVRLVNSTIDYLHDEITSANVSKLTSTGTHVLTEDIAKNGRFAPGIFASDDIVWDLNGHNITFTNTQGYANFLLRGTLHLEINGNGIVTNNAGDYGFWTATEGAKVVINGGTYYAATHVLYAEKGTIEVNGGEFHLTDGDTADKDVNGNFKFLLNCYDANYTAGTANIIVRGGKFYGFDPSNTYGEPGGPISYVAEGYESVPTNEAYEYGTVYEVRPVSE